MTVIDAGVPDARSLGVFTAVREHVTMHKYEIGIQILARMDDTPPVFLSIFRHKENWDIASDSRRAVIESLIEQLTKQLAVEALEGR